uniref:Complex I assembly factor TIMMDC1, mitochondrial n=1 Tax=Coturnix japonica TaxID=93934 RepID=A0A8C2SSN8_COTJA
MAEGLGAGGTFGRPTPPPQTGWERLSELWRRDELQRYPEETINIIKSAFTGGLVGWLYGGLPAFRQARRAFIEGSQGDVFHNRADAVQSAHRAGLRGFIRYGWRWMFTFTGLSVYRDKTTISNFASAGGKTGYFYLCALLYQCR